MPLRPGESRQVARLFGFLQLGEWLAHDVAVRQSRLATEPAARRFLAAQARQEAFHANVFQGANHWLGARGTTDAPGLAGLARYRARAMAALDRGDLAESVLAVQVLFEALGDVALEAIDAGIARRGGGFERLRRALRAQEQTHHAFGVRLLNEQATTAARQRLQQQAQNYLELIHGLFTELDDLFGAFGEDPAEYLAGFRRRLPAWLVAA